MLFFDRNVPSVLSGPGLTYYQREDAGWTAGTTIASQALQSATSVAADPAIGALLYAVLQAENGRTTLAKYAVGVWSSSPIPSFTGDWGDEKVAIAPSGLPEFLRLTTSGLNWFTSERFEQVGGFQEVRGSYHLAVLPTGESVAFFVRRISGDASRFEAVVATRKAANSWSLVVLDQERADPKRCELPPSRAGETCAVDYEFLRPIAVAGAGSDLRFIYSKKRVAGNYVSSCRDHLGYTDCRWGSEMDVITEVGGIHVGWADSRGAGSSLVAPGAFLSQAGSGGTVAVDTSGAIHTALYREIAGGFEVRYVSFSATR